VGETLDWAQALDSLGHREIDRVAADRSLGSLLKAREDLDRVRGESLEHLLDKASDASA